jgi:hypothetical protein
MQNIYQDKIGFQKINHKIDLKILQGEAYFKEARDHKLLLKKVHYHTRKSFFQRLFPSFFSLSLKF